MAAVWGIDFRGARIKTGRLFEVHVASQWRNVPNLQ